MRVRANLSLKRPYNGVMQEDILQLWHFIQLCNELDTLELIEEMAKKYPDPEQAEISFISIWQHLDKRVTL